MNTQQREERQLKCDWVAKNVEVISDLYDAYEIDVMVRQKVVDADRSEWNKQNPDKPKRYYYPVERYREQGFVSMLYKSSSDVQKSKELTPSGYQRKAKLSRFCC